MVLVKKEASGTAIDLFYYNIFISLFENQRVNHSSEKKSRLQ